MQLAVLDGAGLAAEAKCAAPQTQSPTGDIGWIGSARGTRARSQSRHDAKKRTATNKSVAQRKASKEKKEKARGSSFLAQRTLYPMTMSNWPRSGHP
jgi:hypothetical protein